MTNHLKKWFSKFGSWRPTKQNNSQFGDLFITIIVLHKTEVATHLLRNSGLKQNFVLLKAFFFRQNFWRFSAYFSFFPMNKEYFQRMKLEWVSAFLFPFLLQLLPSCVLSTTTTKTATAATTTTMATASNHRYEVSCNS